MAKSALRKVAFSDGELYNLNIGLGKITDDGIGIQQYAVTSPLCGFPHKTHPIALL